MEIIEFSRESWKSANAYYNHLQADEKRGKSVVRVHSIHQISNNKYKLQLSKKIPYIDSAEIKIDSNYYTFDIEENDIRIVEYNEVSAYVVVMTSNRFSEILRQISPENIILESDLTFLVKEVRDWYEKYHDRISFPPYPSVKEMPARPAYASNEQYDAICSVLTSPISYVWGAPGTGKTQMVLANCILHYAENNKQVLLMAPTNNALEQSLRGIIHVLDEKKIDRRKIIRLGKATSSFLIQYPELCEVGHYDSLVDSLKQELDRLKENCEIQKKYSAFVSRYKTYKELISQHSSVIQARDNFNKQTYELNQLLALKQKKIVELQKHKESLESDLACYYEQLKKQEFYPIFIKNHSEYRIIIDKYIAEVNRLSKELIEHKESLSRATEKIVDISAELAQETKILNSYIQKRNSFSFKFKAFFSSAIKKEIEGFILEQKEKVNGINELLKSNESLKRQIQYNIDNIEADIEQQNLIKLGNSALLRISQAVFGENLTYCDLEERFKKKVLEFKDFRIDKKIETKIDSAQQKLNEVMGDLDAKTSELQQIKDEIHEITVCEGDSCNKIRDLRCQISHISFDCFERDLALDKLDELLNKQNEEYDDFVEIPNIEQLIADKEAEYQNIMVQLKDVLKDRTIIACTVDYATIHYAKFVDGLTGSAVHLFADESAYCSLIKSGVFFSFGIPVTLLGDHMQLPPICEMDRKSILGLAENNNIFLWDMSAIHFPDIFDKMKSYSDLLNDYVENHSPQFKNVSVSFLKKTFRFGENLASVLDRFIYSQGFCGNEDSKTEIVVIDAPRKKNETQNTESHSECWAIRGYLNEVKPNNFAVLVPYRNQRDLIEKELRLPAETVMTIHSAQGREWDTVIISVVDATWKFFMSSKNKKSNGLRIVNTAISRAKKKLVLVLDWDCWKYNSNELITEIANVGNILEL